MSSSGLQKTKDDTDERSSPSVPHPLLLTGRAFFTQALMHKESHHLHVKRLNI